MDIESAKLLGAGIAVLGVIGSGIGIGSIFSAFITAVGRNPEAREHVFTMTMLGFALVEALALFALIIALLLSLSGLDFLTAISGAASAISNVGPGLGDVIGPDGNYKNIRIFL